MEGTWLVMVGRLYTIEDEIDVLHEDLGRARRHLDDLLRAEVQGRVADQVEHWKSLRLAEQRVMALEAELREACAQQVAAAEAFAGGLTTGLEEWLGGRP